MNRGKGNSMRRRIGSQRGYTIVEALIFLAVSALLFASTMLLLAGRQNRTQFTNSVRDFETRILDVMNDVSNGYYQNTGNIECTPTDIDVSLGNNRPQGTNLDCVFIGKVLKLGYGNGDSAGTYGIYSLIGDRVAADTATTISTVNPRIVWDDSTTADLVRSQVNLQFGATVSCIGVDSNSCDPSQDNNAAIVFATRLRGGAQTSASGGAIVTDIYTISNALTSSDEGTFAGGVNADISGSGLQRLESGKVLTICVQSGTTNQYALFRIVNSGVTTTVKDGNICQA